MKNLIAGTIIYKYLAFLNWSATTQQLFSVFSYHLGKHPIPFLPRPLAPAFAGVPVVS